MHAVFAGHTTGAPMHAPVASHASPDVIIEASSQAIPGGTNGREHWPVEESHTPCCSHRPGAGHCTGASPVHVPERHTSVAVHAFESSHEVPLSGACSQAAATQLSAV